MVDIDKKETAVNLLEASVEAQQEISTLTEQQLLEILKLEYARQAITYLVLNKLKNKTTRTTGFKIVKTYVGFYEAKAFFHKMEGLQLGIFDKFTFKWSYYPKHLWQFCQGQLATVQTIKVFDKNQNEKFFGKSKLTTLPTQTIDQILDEAKRTIALKLKIDESRVKISMSVTP